MCAMSDLFSTNSPQFVLGEASGIQKLRWAGQGGHGVEPPRTAVAQPGGELRIYSGPGDDTATVYYEGLGQTIDTYSYSP